MTGSLRWILAVSMGLLLGNVLLAQDLESQLRNVDPSTLAARARLRGNPKQGALVFFKSAAACAKCHEPSEATLALGPKLTELGDKLSDEYLVEAVLYPSKTIRKGYETVRVLTDDGRLHVGLVQSKSDEEVVLRDANNIEQETKIPRDTIDEMAEAKQSLMPDGLVSSLSNEKQFYDLVRYLSEVAHGGAQRAAELRPSAAELTVTDDSVGLDHAGIIRSLGERDIEAGQRIFQGYCVNCHGTDGNTPKLPTARAFGKDPFKFGADPYEMFLTLTRGAGLMAPMQHLSPRERYQVVAYIREELMKGRNPVYREATPGYLSGLPKGTGTGERENIGERDYGPVLASQIGREVNNALTFRLNDEVTASYDLHRMRLAGAWRGGFLDLSQTHHYLQRGEQMPRIAGDLLYGLSDWQWKLGDSFDLPASAKPPRGPVSSHLATYHGHYLHGDQAILSYTIGGRDVLETIEGEVADKIAVLRHTLRVEPGNEPLELSIGRLEPLPQPNVDVPHLLTESRPVESDMAVIYGQPDVQRRPPTMANKAWHVVSGEEARKLDLGTPGRTIMVRFKTDGEGTLVSSGPAEGKWTPDGKTLFVRGGRLVFDIGWVGAIVGKTKVNDNQWHVAAVVVGEKETRLYVDGKLEASRAKFRRPPVADHVLKVGATATNFGGDFVGEMDWVRILDQVPSAKDAALPKPTADNELFTWKPIANQPVKESGSESTLNGVLVAAELRGNTSGLTWSRTNHGRAVLTIPASDQPRLFQVVRASCETLDELAHFPSVREIIGGRSIRGRLRSLDPRRRDAVAGRA